MRAPEWRLRSPGVWSAVAGADTFVSLLAAGAPRPAARPAWWQAARLPLGRTLTGEPLVATILCNWSYAGAHSRSTVRQADRGTDQEGCV